MTLSPIKTITYQLYLFQLENYRIRRFLKLLGKNFGQPNQTQRKQVVWTLKLSYLFSLSLILQSALSFGAGYVAYRLFAAPATLAVAAGIITFYVLSLFFFLVLIPVAVAYMPLDYLLKRRIIRRAKRKMARVSRAKIIGITGSYGKTTMKEALAAVLSEKFKVLKTLENINTPLGVSRLILDKLTADTEIFVVEMGAYQKGDIQTICDIVPPDISIVTGINESHLERFGSIENTIKTKFEIVEATKRAGLVVLNADDKLVAAHYQEYIKGQKICFYASRNNPLVPYQISEMRFFEDGSGISFNLASRERNFGTIKIPLLGEYAAGIVMACVCIARELGMSNGEIQRGIANIKPISHRLEPIRGASGVLVIDDSYNGNP
ncbi:UDP-N-acetylmuramoyl-tripeptide--D-alanyl-D-alanine ligase, partial [Patescibacteria group bacterium]|nr:UDP-N-acetylmuramoyl-tripeptide--D-alanyl-D-alanine ligase [Patescibacteria group bacterium]